MMKLSFPRVTALATLALLTLSAGLTSPALAAEEPTRTFDQTAASAQADLERALAELSALRTGIAEEKLPLNRKLGELESRLVDVRARFQDKSRELDAKNLELSNSESGIKALAQEKDYLSNLLAEYLRNLETRIHIAERQRYTDLLRQAHEAPGNGNLSPAEAFGAQSAMVEASLDRLLDVAGGATFDGTAVDPETGVVKDATFAVIGPVAVYQAKDGSSAGLAQELLNSLQPNMIPLDSPEQRAGIATLVGEGAGTLPLDPTLGNAQKVEATKETVAEHIAKGGPVMVPILLLAGTSLLLALIKWFQLSRVRRPSQRKVDALLDAVKRGDYATANERARAIQGPTGEMVRAALENISEPKVLIEEVMFEKTLETRLKLQSFLSFIQVSAAAAPLLGLLGTVTGMINTFKLITVFGTGDAKTLSGGISEALITTEFGLIIAIPALLMHAYLSRKARRTLDAMEKVAVSFLNRVRSVDEPAVDEEPSPAGARMMPLGSPGMVLRGAVPQVEGTDH